MNNFWEQLPKPFFALAPMADVTDAAFRHIIVKYGKPDVMWTEFVSADGLASAGREVLKRDLEYSENERPIVAQLFSSHPEKMRQAAKICAEMGFDGIDINMGCPDKSIEKQGAGAAMIKTPEIAAQIIQAAKDGIKDAAKEIPVSVKTRVGYNAVQIGEWIPFLLSQNIAALSVHARTRKDMSKIPAQWDYIKKVVAIRDKIKCKTKIIGNGDVRDITHGRMLAEETGCDGIMIGRAIFGNPWLFTAKEEKEFFSSKRKNNFIRKLFLFLKKKDKYWLKKKSSVSTQERLRVMVEHTKLFEKLLGDIKSFNLMKKHYKAYINGFDGAKELRIKCMEASSASEVEAIVENFVAHQKSVL